MNLKQKLSFCSAAILPVLAFSAYLLLNPHAAKAASCAFPNCEFNGTCYSNLQCLWDSQCAGGINDIARCLDGVVRCGACE